MKILCAVEIRTYRLRWCHRKCPELEFMQMRCKRFPLRKLVFDSNARYLRCQACMEAKRAF